MDIKLVPFNGAKHGSEVERWIVDPEYAHFFQGIGMVPTSVDCANYPQWVGHSVMMIEDKDKYVNKVLGMVFMCRPIYRSGTCEIGILIDREDHEQGLARQAGNMWLKFLLSLGFRNVIACVLDEGLKDLLVRSGWKLEGTHKEESLIDGKYVDEYRLAYIRGG